MDFQYDDIWFIIINLLKDKDKINLFTTCKYLRSFHNKIYYTDIHNYHKVKNLSFIKRINKIKYVDDGKEIPNIVNYLVVTNFTFSVDIIPKNIKYLEMDLYKYFASKKFLTNKK
ncbi:hypothetical protein H012_gp151 [Acanthamoeba polyphaga moumouvirus]|uniref:F-box and FNIP repeat-containing protein n=1 Tax=Acanthamoeba polyphaga moumouvirus TaxID=1269028 RepID=L7RCH5_9VIRU|nr:hypothetical protein H012_gp151 [Acanthamoeba polyphaga moumouvirus]AGC02299.1 hypothetical protein Moumou_00781 [Acanthamoeba polyphaga moumouvirus]